MQGEEFFHLHMGGTADGSGRATGDRYSDGGPGQSQWRSQSHLLFPPPDPNEGDWSCWNAKNAKGMLSTMYGTFCLTAFSSVHDSKF